MHIQYICIYVRKHVNVYTYVYIYIYIYIYIIYIYIIYRHAFICSSILHTADTYTVFMTFYVLINVHILIHTFRCKVHTCI